MKLSDDVEIIDLKTGRRLAQSLRRDLQLACKLEVDHEGLGTLILDYTGTPAEDRIQALISLMGALTERLAAAIGDEQMISLLKSAAAERELRE